jgi:hypothetical protein
LSVQPVRESSAALSSRAPLDGGQGRRVNRRGLLASSARHMISADGHRRRNWKGAVIARHSFPGGNEKGWPNFVVGVMLSVGTFPRLTSRRSPPTARRCRRGHSLRRVRDKRDSGGCRDVQNQAADPSRRAACSRILAVARPCGVDRHLRVGVSRHARRNRRCIGNTLCRGGSMQ